MAHSRRAARLVIAVSVALLLSYALIWSRVSAVEIGRSDFTATYVGATLVRTGHASSLYDESIQSPLHASLIRPDNEGNLPFVEAPLAAALAAPVTLLPLDTAYVVWALLQLVLLVAAVAIAVRSAPWPSGTSRAWRIAAASLALAAAGTLIEALQAQWPPVSALGLALAYREWRQGHDQIGAAVLVMSAGMAKPHLAFGLLAFLLGWRNRRILTGALAGGVVIIAANVAVAGPGGVAAFVRFAVTTNSRWDLRSFSSFVGIPGSFLGNGAAAQPIGLAGSAIALAATFWLGSHVALSRNTLSNALAGAACLSLLAAPHLEPHDLVMLAPVIAWSMAAASRMKTARNIAATACVIALTSLLTAAAFVSVADHASLPFGQLTPWVLIAASAIAARAVALQSRDVQLTSLRDAATVGSLADGVRGRRDRDNVGVLSL